MITGPSMTSSSSLPKDLFAVQESLRERFYPLGSSSASASAALDDHDRQGHHRRRDSPSGGALNLTVSEKDSMANNLLRGSSLNSVAGQRGDSSGIMRPPSLSHASFISSLPPLLHSSFLHFGLERSSSASLKDDDDELSSLRLAHSRTLEALAQRAREVLANPLPPPPPTPPQVGGEREKPALSDSKSNEEEGNFPSPRESTKGSDEEELDCEVQDLRVKKRKLDNDSEIKDKEEIVEEEKTESVVEGIEKNDD